jgi:hypothetical protein
VARVAHQVLAMEHRVQILFFLALHQRAAVTVAAIPHLAAMVVRAAVAAQTVAELVELAHQDKATMVVMV